MRILISALLATLVLVIGYHSYHDTNPVPSRGGQSDPMLSESDTVTPTAIAPSLGQHFMIGHWADTPVASTSALIREYGIGGVIIMSAPDDPTEIQDWVTQWQAASPHPLLIAIDQEGGPVSRLKGNQFDLTGQATITDTATAYRVGYTRGQELRALGITMNFAPVLDSATNPESFMFSRVFPNRELSPILAAAMVRGMADADVIAVVKHFPGHDDTSEDSHLTLPVVPYANTGLDNFLSPFFTLLTTEPPPALMTAHVAFPAVDPLPATLSPYWLKTYLRDTVNYTGVIVTDDMIMDAIDTSWTHNQASVMALKAGADLILYAAEPQKVTAAIEMARTALLNGELSATDLHKSLERIQHLNSPLQ